jgi:hypothetical protein
MRNVRKHGAVAVTANRIWLFVGSLVVPTLVYVLYFLFLRRYGSVGLGGTDLAALGIATVTSIPFAWRLISPGRKRPIGLVLYVAAVVLLLIALSFYFMCVISHDCL